MDGPRSLIWDQSENRLHVQKALLAGVPRTSGGTEAPGRAAKGGSAARRKRRSGPGVGTILLVL